VVGRGGFGCRGPSKTAGVQGAALKRRTFPSGIQRRWRPHCKESRKLIFCSWQLVAAWSAIQAPPKIAF